MSDMFPSLTRSKKLSPGDTRRFAMDTTNRRFARTIRFFSSTISS